MIGGAVGALLGSLFHIGATAYGVTGIPGFLITLDYTAQYAIVLGVSFAIAFALTWIFWKEEKETGIKEKSEVKAAEKIEEKEETTENKASFVTILSPLKGNIISRDLIPDETFASGVLGDGVGIEPEEGVVVAPVDGEISSTVDSRHAVGITGPNDMEILIHVGIDTVNMNGDGFEMHVKEGDKVKAGDKLITFSIDKIKAAGYSTTTAVLLTNSDDYNSCQIIKTGKTDTMEPVITVE